MDDLLASNGGVESERLRETDSCRTCDATMANGRGEPLESLHARRSLGFFRSDVDSLLPSPSLAASRSLRPWLYRKEDDLISDRDRSVAIVGEETVVTGTFWKISMNMEKQSFPEAIANQLDSVKIQYILEERIPGYPLWMKYSFLSQDELSAYRGE